MSIFTKLKEFFLGKPDDPVAVPAPAPEPEKVQETAINPVAIALDVDPVVLPQKKPRKPRAPRTAQPKKAAEKKAAEKPAAAKKPGRKPRAAKPKQ